MPTYRIGGVLSKLLLCATSEALHKKSSLLPKNSRAKAQSRKALPRFKGFLWAFAPLRENVFLYPEVSDAI
jgi:hypothetical protein